MTPLRISNLRDLNTFREEAAREQSKFRARVLVCATGCRALGAMELSQAFREKLAAAGLAGEVAVVEAGCHGQCARAPLVLIEPQDYLYGQVTPEDIDDIIRVTLRQGKPVERLCEAAHGQVWAKIGTSPFYRDQRREVFRHCGRVDPKRIDDAIIRGAYQAAAKALGAMSPEQVISEVTGSGLRGRGGAGFPSGVKWSFCRKQAGKEKYLICNADEGDPGAFMDRALLEGVPHQVIEGMIIAAYAIGASRGFVYVRAEYPIAVEHIGIAIEQARAYGLLGRNILGSGFDFDIEVRMGAGAFVCGEETALIASLEGQRGMPRPRPPFPAESGYLGKPTTINNVETFGNVPLIILNGKDWYAAIGTEGSKGTKVFALAGKVRNTGLVEVPMGISLRQIVYDIGGGIPKNRRFKAVQMGGPSGGCLPAKFLDLPIDYDSVKSLGAIIGSGGLIVMDERTCMVDMARFFMEFVQSESCGKCPPCRIGTRHMLDILTRICAGYGREGDIEALERLGNDVKLGSLCGLGQTAPNPVLTTIKYFREEYEEHITLKQCRASVCGDLMAAPCAHACPADVNVPEYLALIAEGRLDAAVAVVRRRNPFVSVCGRVCDHPCESRCRRADVDEAIAIRALKRYMADHAREDVTSLKPPVEGKAQVAIVGSGPAGLSCAYFLALMGRGVVVFEKQPVPGGMLALGIPEYRLPKKILAKEIDFILKHGVELRTGTAVSSADDLLSQGYKAVFVATGAQKARPLGVEGENLDGVQDSLDFLRARALGQKPKCGRHVVVVGGGNAAVDAARSALRLGGGKVTILYRRTRDEMPAYQEEVEEALNEGIEILELAAPKRLIGKQGKVAGIEAIRMRLGTADDDGRRRPQPIAGSEFEIACDMVLPAVGQLPSVEVVGAMATARHTLESDKVTLQTSREGVFAGGDVISGGGSVIEAIAAGQRAAGSIDRYLGGPGALPPDVTSNLRQPSDAELMKVVERVKEPALSVKSRLSGFSEVIQGMSREDACAEAGRCLRCDLEKIRR